LRHLLPALFVLSACGRGAPSVDAARDVPSAREDFVDVEEEEEVRDAGPRFTPPTQIVALSVFTPVRREPRRDALAIGYMRAGAVAAVETGPHGREGCPVRRGHPEGGWYKVVGGGYVCIGGAMAQAWPQRDFLAPTQPDFDASLPYPYAINYGRTVMYRHVPSRSELRQYEPWRYETASADASAPTPPAEADAGGRRTRREARDAGVVRLSDLRGERGGPVVRRLLSGMYVSLDRRVRDRETGERYWHTQTGGYVRDGRLSMLRDIPTFRGTELDGEARHLPVAWMVSEEGFSYRLAPNRRSASYHRRLPRLSFVQLLDEPPLRIGAQTFYAANEGLAVNARSVRRAERRDPPAGVGPTERWFDIDLDEQVLVAYEGPRPVYATLISSGRRDDPRAEERFETPTGSFRVYAKHVTTTMDGDTATDGPYSIEDVPWVMYFRDNYAIHGAFWHHYYGWRMSHGCVNLAPLDARWTFLWADPQVPRGWHGVFVREGMTGSRVELRHSRQNAREEGRPAGAARATQITED
jgi:hypothetical protein